MKQRILQVITSALLIITLTMANFLLLCVDVVSYALDEINADRTTNHKNVEFVAYFKDGDGNNVTEVDAYTNNEDLKLYFQISVKQEGYFNGNIVLNDANFKLKTDILSEGVSKIENNIISLNQINAGETREIEVGIELLKDEEFDVSLISMESGISIKGIYKDSTEKDITIDTEKNVTLKYVSPYTVEEGSIFLTQEVITNKILNVGGEDKKVIQVEVNSGLNNNLFPVKKSTINIQVPKISDKYPEEVLVNSNDILVTNGKELTKDNWNYDSETGKITITIENTSENNKVSWIKTGNDKIIVTYIYDKEVQINDEKLVIDSEIELYDSRNTTFSFNRETSLTASEVDTIVKTSIDQNENSIYKGKLYEGISRDITYKNTIEINLNNVASEINVTENQQTINGTNIPSVYKTTTINKANIVDILGETGTLTIINTQTAATIATINNETQADNNGNIIITYPENVQSIVIKLTAAENIGKIEIENTKTINAIDKEELKSATQIDFTAETSYISNSVESKVENATSSITLNETETSVDLEISRTELSAMTTNSNVEFKITLNSKEEKNELFKNPVLRLQLPEKIKEIKVNSINMYDEEEMEIVKPTLDNNVIEIPLQGEQTKYKEEAIDGAVIVINADLTTDMKIPSSTEQVTLTYSNGKAVNYANGAEMGTVQKEIKIVSYAGVVTTNQISEYGIDIVNNAGTKSAQLDISADAKIATVEEKIINNKGNKISNVRILGTFPTNGATSENNVDVEVGTIAITGIDASRAKVYYSTNASATDDLENANNGWTEAIQDTKAVKKYLVVVNELDLLEEIDLTYNITIPAGLEYNKTVKESYSVYYTNAATAIAESVNVDEVKLSTGVGPVVEATLKAFVGEEEATNVKEEEIIKYEITVSNTGTEDVTNVQVSSKVPENTVYVEANEWISQETQEGQEDIWKPFSEYPDKEIVEFSIDNLAVGETITKTYQVRVKDNTAGTTISNQTTIKYGEVTKTSSEVTNIINEGDLKTILYSKEKDNTLKGGYTYRYILEITNKSNRDKENVRINVNLGDIIELKEIFYITEDQKLISEEENSYIDLDLIKSGETITVALLIMPKFYTNIEKQECILSTTVTDNNEIYHSNVAEIVVTGVDVDVNISSNNSNSYVSVGDTIEYSVLIKNNGSTNIENIQIEDIISNKTTLSKITKNGEVLTNNQYSVENDISGSTIIEVSDELKAGEQIEYKIEVLVNNIPENTKALEIINNTTVYVNYTTIESIEIRHILEPETGSTTNPDEDPSEDPSQDPSEEDTVTKAISGIVWVDEDADGQKDNQEQVLSGITVRLLNVETNEFVQNSEGNELTATTNESGFYSFDAVAKGRYIVIFEYDTARYILTTYEQNQDENNISSKVINRTVTINGEEKTVGSTEIIEVNNENIANINMGLQLAKNVDLKLDKYVSRVVIQNSKGTVTNEFDNATYAKAEIDAKLLNNTTVVVEYTIKITNIGEVDAYARRIADYISKDYKFSSDLNKDWYQSGDVLYNASLSNEAIAPGESKELKLVVTKQMTETNTGLINNTAEIIESYNELGLTDENDNNSNSADLTLSIKTGQIVSVVALILSTIIIVGGATYVIATLIIRKRLI